MTRTPWSTSTVIADNKKQQHLDRIANARHQKACVVAARLLGQGRIKEADMEEVITDLSKLELSRIEPFAERVFRTPAEKKANQTIAAPVVQEPSDYATEQAEVAENATEPTLAEQLDGVFSVGGETVDKAIKEMEAESSK